MIKRRLEKLEAQLRKSLIVPFVVVRRGGLPTQGLSNNTIIINIIPRREREEEGTIR